MLNPLCVINHVEPFFEQSGALTTLNKKPFKDIVGKGENAGDLHFLLFPQYFLPCQRLK